MIFSKPCIRQKPDMKPVIQEEKAGCAIACSAAASGITCKKAKVYQLFNSDADTNP